MSIYITDSEKKEYTSMIEKALKSELNIDSECTIDNNKDAVSFIIVALPKPKNTNSYTIISKFYLTNVPNCCGAIISHGVYVSYGMQNKGIGKVIHKCRLEIMRRLEFSCAICMDVKNNKPQEKILEKFGWKNLHTFRNKNSGNKVNIYAVDLKKVYKKKAASEQTVTSDEE